MGKKSGGKTRKRTVPLHPLDLDPSQSVVSVNTNASVEPGSDRGIPGPSVWRLVDIEPLLMIHLVASMIGYVGNQNLLVVKACTVDLGLDEKMCLSIGQKTVQDEQDIQKLLTSLVMWRSIIGNFLPMILVAQIGAWSDKYGRKLPMIMVMFTFFVEYVFMMWSAYYRDQISAWKTGLIASGISSLAGNNACFGMALFSYISDVTPKDKLTARTSISGSCYFLGILVGLTIGGHLASAPLPLVN
ncbi:unnamed protein product [Allacma fusca]|uniref:Uncharacterized protein n=1 Tax=Allacma fusca TaxID=39272 RepID=A0A8J2PDK6_9HEXA|nr:unnamed protein product [Allacma fusca]